MTFAIFFRFVRDHSEFFSNQTALPVVGNSALGALDVSRLLAQLAH